MVSTITCVLFRSRLRGISFGIYDPEWVHKLYRGFRRNTLLPFRFVCITDFPAEEFDQRHITVVPFLRDDHVGSWMCINEIFRPDLGIERGVFVGLDTIICGNIDELLSYEGDFAMGRHCWKPEVIMNAVTLWNGNTGLWEEYDRNPGKAISRSAGVRWASVDPSEMLFWSAEKEGCDILGEKGVCPNTKIRSFKLEPHLLDDADVVYFHGRNKPPLAKHRIISDHWR